MKKWALLPSLPTRAVVLAEAAQVQLVIFKPVVFNGTYIINTLVKLLKISLNSKEDDLLVIKLFRYVKPLA